MPDNENENLLATQDLEDSVSIDNLTQSPDIDGDDVVVMVHENNGVKSTYKAILRSIANFINKLLHYSSDLHTQNDTIIGAINELADGGGGGSADITTEITTPASIQTFTDGGDNIPLKSCVVAIPENTQGISSVNIGVNGKNFYPLKVGFDLFTDNRSATHTTNDDILSITMDSQNNSGVYGGTGSSLNNQICQTIKKFSGEFVLSLYAKTDVDNKDVYFGFQSFYNTVATLSTSWQRIEVPMTLDGTIHILNFYNRSGSAITVDIKDVQIEIGQTATEYEDYVGDNYSISLGETLTQGGTLEAVSGLLTRADTTTSQLTGSKIPTVSGVNNIYADSGNINSLEYFNENADQTSELIDAKQEFCNYSYDEKIVGKWIDGSPLYEKTLYFNNVKLDKSDSTSELVHGISDIGSVRFVSEVYFDFSGGVNGWSPANNGLWNNGVYNFYWVCGETSLYILSASGVYFDANTNRSYLAKIRYTKA